MNDFEQAFRIVLFGLENMAGGEIFIPKAPTMKLTDLFDVIVPKVKRRIIGIRPGEKVHEILLTKDEARHAVEFKGYFIVLPEHATKPVQKKQERFLKAGKKLPPEYSFESHTGNVKLSEKELLRFIRALETKIAR